MKLNITISSFSTIHSFIDLLIASPCLILASDKVSVAEVLCQFKNYTDQNAGIGKSAAIQKIRVAQKHLGFSYQKDLLQARQLYHRFDSYCERWTVNNTMLEFLPAAVAYQLQKLNEVATFGTGEEQSAAMIIIGWYLPLKEVIENKNLSAQNK